jgi:hypothetical protein
MGDEYHRAEAGAAADVNANSADFRQLDSRLAVRNEVGFSPQHPPEPKTRLESHTLADPRTRKPKGVCAGPIADLPLH